MSPRPGAPGRATLHDVQLPLDIDVCPPGRTGPKGRVRGSPESRAPHVGGLGSATSSTRWGISACESGTASASTYWPLADALGSVYALTDSAGAVVRNYAYDVLGERTTSGSGPSLSFGFTGREHDASGLNYNRDRYLDKILGRWTQPDRMGFIDGPNVYQYAMGDPVRAKDPTGRMSIIDYIISTIDAAMIVASFFGGMGAQAMSFGPDTSATAAIRESPGYLQVFQLYKNQVAQSSDGKSYQAKFKVPGCSTFLEILANPLAEVLGTFMVAFIPNQRFRHIVTVVAWNTTSLSSLGHGNFDGLNELPSFERPFGGLLPMPFANVRQKFYWTEFLE